MVADFSAEGKLLGLRIDLQFWNDSMPVIEDITEEEYKQLNTSQEDLIPQNPMVLKQYLNDALGEAVGRVLPNMDDMMPFSIEGGMMKKAGKEMQKRMREVAKEVVPVKRRYKIIKPSGVPLAFNHQDQMPQPMIGEPIMLVLESAQRCSALKLPMHNWNMAKPRLAKINEHLFLKPCIEPGDPIPFNPSLLARYKKEAIMDGDELPPSPEVVH